MDPNARHCPHYRPGGHRVCSNCANELSFVGSGFGDSFHTPTSTRIDRASSQDRSASQESTTYLSQYSARSDWRLWEERSLTRHIRFNSSLPSDYQYPTNIADDALYGPDLPPHGGGNRNATAGPSRTANSSRPLMYTTDEHTNMQRYQPHPNATNRTPTAHNTSTPNAPPRAFPQRFGPDESHHLVYRGALDMQNVAGGTVYEQNPQQRQSRQAQRLPPSSSVRGSASTRSTQRHRHNSQRSAIPEDEPADVKSESSESSRD